MSYFVGGASRTTRTYHLKADCTGVYGDPIEFEDIEDLTKLNFKLCRTCGVKKQANDITDILESEEFKAVADRLKQRNIEIRLLQCNPYRKNGIQIWSNKADMKTRENFDPMDPNNMSLGDI